MKKLISVVAAFAVTISAFSSLASAANLYSYYNEPDSFTADELNKFNVPKEDYVPVGLSVGLVWNGGESYRSSITKSFSYSQIATVSDTTFDARAQLDMVNVAKEWNALLDKASNEDAAKRAAAIDNAKLSGEFKITIEDTTTETSQVGKDIDNADVKALTKDALKWVDDLAGYNVEKFFEFKSMEKVGDQYVITMALKDYSGINKDLDEYFTALAAADKTDDYALLLEIEDSNVPAPSSTGTYKYQVTGTIGGYVDIALGSDKLSTIWFGAGDKDDAGENIAAAKSADITVTKAGRGGGGGGGGSTTGGATPTPIATEAPIETSSPVEAPTATPVANPQQGGLSSGAQLNYDDHFAYIIGYNLEEGETLAQVRPNANITRAEVATIFFRLLTDESRAKLWTKTNSFSDVPADEWYNNAISTDAKAGIMEGSNGTFRPNAPITRAEFATIAARFSSVTYTGEDKFSDIAGHWAAEYINKAAETGWITGYDDGTFRPNANITRAEAMTLINRLVYRIVDKNSLIEAGMTKWSDNLDTNAWYYADVQEATNSHDYQRTDVGYVEKWTETKTARDWEALEKTWSVAASAGAEESVFTDSGLEELNTENTK